MLEVMKPQKLSAPSLFSEGIRLSDERQFGLKKDHTTGCSVELSAKHAKYNMHSKGLPASITDSYEERFESLEDLEAQTIGNLLPDDDDLFSGVADGFDRITRLSNGDEMEELDFFSSVGGFELGEDGFSQGTFSPRASFEEHILVDHPSRTLFVRNIRSNVEDSELTTIFEQYGDIRTLCAARKHRGFLLVSYYDIRAACNAMNALQNKLLKHQKIDIHFSIPTENSTKKDTSHGTLAVFNSSLSNNQLLEIFGAYGEVKEIREIPCWSNHRLVEFYDVRAAEAALSALKNIQIFGKHIHLEPCGPGGSKSFLQPLPSEMENMESGSLLFQQSWSTNLASSFSDNGTVLGLHSNSLPSPLRADLGKPSNAANHLKFEIQSPNFNTFSHLECNNAFSNVLHVGGSPSHVSAHFASRIPEVVDSQQFCRVVPNGQPMETQVFASAASGNCTPCHNFMWNNSLPHQPQGIPWSNSPSFFNGIGAIPLQHLRGVPYIANSVPNLHVGSAPSVNPTLWDPHNFYAGGSPDASIFHPGSLGNLKIYGNSPHSLDYVPHAATNGVDISIASKSVGLQAKQQRCMLFLPRSNERNRHHINEGNLSQTENRKQFELDIERIIRGEDKRTTLMIKNIPNKYTSKMLLAAIDERHKGSYDFIYLPIDFKNKCNMGYAFINMTEPSLIVPFYKTFNGKRWEKFNSEKVAYLAYARIQGKAALIAHFQNSSLMNEDKRCRPILFRTDGPNAGDQVPFPVGGNIRQRPGKLRTSSTSDESAQENVHTSVANDKCAIGDFSPGSAKDSD